MPKTKISEFSSTPGNNTDIDGINIAEGCAPSGINDAIRELMSQLKDFQAGTAGDSFNGPVGTTTAAAGAFTTLSASGAVTLSGGTANGVPYLNGSKVLTTGSALTFDGTNLVVGGYARLGQNSFLQSSDGSGGWVELIKADSSNNTVINNNKNLPILFNLNSSEQMRLTSTGLGIGTSSPGHRLVVSQANTTAYASSSGSLVEPAGGANTQIVNTGTGGFASLRFAALDGSYAQGYLAFANSGGSTTGYFALGQRTGGSSYAEQLRLDSSGNLGLGVTPSAWRTSGDRALQIGSRLALYSDSGVTTDLGNNVFVNASSQFAYLTTAAATRYQQHLGAHSWFTAPSGTAGAAISFTQAMTLDASGNWGLGTSSISSFTGYTVAQINGSTSGLVEILSNGTRVGGLFNDPTGSSGNGDFLIRNLQNGALRFLTNNTERARIDSSGNLLVGTTSAQSIGGRLTVVRSSDNAGTFITDTNNFPLVAWQRGGTSNLVFFGFGSGGTQIGTITTNGTSTFYNTSSDYRLKHDIQPMTGALAKVAALKPCTYKWNVNDSDGEGFIAHELAEVFPGAVTGEKDAVNEDGSIKPQGIDTSFLVATLTAAIQEQQAIINQLTARIEALEQA